MKPDIAGWFLLRSAVHCGVRQCRFRVENIRQLFQQWAWHIEVTILLFYGVARLLFVMG